MASDGECEFFQNLAAGFLYSTDCNVVFVQGNGELEPMAPHYFVGSVLQPHHPCWPSLKRWILHVAVIVLIWPSAEGQGRNDVWALGDSILLEMGPTGFEFSRTIPFYAHEGVTSICDATGKLLFYSNSTTVFNRFDDTLQNGQILDVGSLSVNQGCMAVPVPRDSNRYFFFNLEYQEGDRVSAFVSIADIRLDSGQGGIVPGFKSRLLNNNLGEQIQIVRHGNGIDWWVLLRPIWSDSIGLTKGFLSFRLTADSILGPWFQDVGRGSRYVGSELTVSPDGEKIALCSYGSNLIQTFSFDRCSGMINEAALIYDTVGGGYFGISFDPESRVLYGVRSGPRVLNQFYPDGDGFSQHEIVRFGASPGSFLGPLELGPDGRVYIACRSVGGEPDTTHFYLGVIREPTLEGMSCAYDTFGVWLGGSVSESVAIPNQANFDLGILEGSPCDTSSTAIPNWSLNAERWSVYPNPAMNRFCLVGEGEAELASVVLYNTQGREVWQAQDATSSSGNTHCFTLSEALPPGSYLLRVMADEGSESIRLQIGR